MTLRRVQESANIAALLKLLDDDLCLVDRGIVLYETLLLLRTKCLMGFKSTQGVISFFGTG